MNTEEYQKLKEDLKEQWTQTLLTMFGGMDYWQLNKAWKKLRCERVASMIVEDITYAMDCTVNNMAGEKTHETT